MEEAQMLETLFNARFSKVLGISLMTGAGLAVAFTPSKAEDKIQPPPYQLAGLNGVTLGVVWDEAAIRKALPPGIEPVKGMTGGINIYSAERAYVIGPYSSTYYFVDIEGFDSPEGIKGRWMLAGVYGPQAKASAAFKASGFPVRPGTSRSEPTADGKRAIGTVNGQDFITAEYKSVPGSCEPAAIELNYVTMSPQAEQLVVSTIPGVLDACKAELVSAKVDAPSGDPFAAFPIAKVVGISEFRNGSFAPGIPQPVRK
jgi:hypothetical protein